MNYNVPNQPNYQPVVSVGDWIITLIVTSIPVIGFIMLIVWAVDTSTPKSKSNYAKAALIVYAIVIVFSFLLVSVIGFGILTGGRHFSGFDIH